MWLTLKKKLGNPLRGHAVLVVIMVGILTSAIASATSLAGNPQIDAATL